MPNSLNQQREAFKQLNNVAIYISYYDEASALTMETDAFIKLHSSHVVKDFLHRFKHPDHTVSADLKEYLLGVHHCRVGYIYAMQGNWQEADARFDQGLHFLKSAVKNEGSHESALFFAQACYSQGLIRKLYLNDNEGAAHAFKKARDSFEKLTKTITMDDKAYALSYLESELVAKLDGGKINQQEFSKKLEKFKFDHFNPSNVALYASNNVAWSDEVNKASELYAKLQRQIPTPKPSPWGTVTLFPPVQVNIPQDQQDKHSELTYVTIQKPSR